MILEARVCSTFRAHIRTTRSTRDSPKALVLLLPADSPDQLRSSGYVRTSSGSPTNLAEVALDRLEALVRNRLERLPDRPETLDGFIVGTGLALDQPGVTLTSRSP